MSLNRKVTVPVGGLVIDYSFPIRKAAGRTIEVDILWQHLIDFPLPPYKPYKAGQLLG